jgi:hypothetical protein
LFPSNCYALARERGGGLPRLRDSGDAPPERLLQAAWQHQRIQRDRLQTLDGRPVRVLHPGFINRESGPDFHDALIGLGDDPPQRGDVEVDLRAGGWHAHGHDCNPSFNNVILHVIWDADGAGDRANGQPADAHPPILPLRTALDAPLGELARWLGGDAAGAFPENLRGRCCGPLRVLPAERLTALLHEAATVRLHSNAAQFQARARSVGWEQALWEGLFRALGYKHNAWPMQILAETRPQWSVGCASALDFQARLLGLSGLLPAELARGATSAHRYLRRVWDQWWRERESLGDCVLPRAAWHLHGLRPANHPQRRLALAAHWLAGGTLAGKLEGWCVGALRPADFGDSLLAFLQPPRDAFWSWHWTLRSSCLPRPQPLLGGARVTDLAVNVILPWLWMRAAEGGNDRVRTELEARYFNWPAGEDNAVLRLARQRLLGGAPARTLGGAAAQQGLLQITRDFCDHANAVCDACRFPDVVRGWPSPDTMLSPD